MSVRWFELSCGECGESKHRLQIWMKPGGYGSPVTRVKATCAGCGAVTYLFPTLGMQLAPGHPQGEEDEGGMLAPMDWQRDSEGKPI